jgi:lipopolysaccharide export LptBFGC system permease protein LptF
MIRSFLHSRFWLPLLIVAATLALAPVFRGFQPPLQSHGLALLLSGTLALSGYLVMVIAQPEKF